MIFIETATYHVTKNNKPCSVVSKFLGMVWRLGREGRPLLFPILEKRKGLLLDLHSGLTGFETLKIQALVAPSEF